MLENLHSAQPFSTTPVSLHTLTRSSLQPITFPIAHPASLTYFLCQSGVYKIPYLCFSSENIMSEFSDVSTQTHCQRPHTSSLSMQSDTVFRKCRPDNMYVHAYTTGQHFFPKKPFFASFHGKSCLARILRYCLSARAVPRSHRPDSPCHRVYTDVISHYLLR